MTPSKRIRVLIVDDSAIVRRILSEAVASDPELEVVGTAPDAFVARDKIVSLKPDVLTLDIEMPRMDGLTFLKRLMHFHPLPVIVISSLGQSSCRVAIEALSNGAVEVLPKPGGPYSVADLRTGLTRKIRAAANARTFRNTAKPAPPTPPRPLAAGVRKTSWPARSLIAIGASTGGTEAIQQVLTQLPADVPGMVITQHIPAGFSRAFANRLNEICPMAVREAADGDRVEPGLALIAPGNFHMTVESAGQGYRVAVRDGTPVCYQRPSVDVLFESVATAAGTNAVAAILTGMGADGAQGMLRMRRAGARTLAQDETTCVVYGMPREAVRLGAAERSLPLDKIAAGLLAALKSGTAAR